MKIVTTILTTIAGLVYLAACTTTFEDHIHPLSESITLEDYGVLEPRTFLQCDGYLTNVPSQNYCSESVPEDWQGFKFNDELFYMVPLLSSKEELLALPSENQPSKEYVLKQGRELTGIEPD